MVGGTSRLRATSGLRFPVPAQTPTSFQDFGSVALNASPVTVPVTFQFAGLASPTFSLRYGTDFTQGNPSCTGTSVIVCSVPVTFAPQMPGLRQDAVLVTNTSGGIVAQTFLRGVGLGAEAVTLPGTMSTFAGTGAWNYTGDNGPATSATFRQPQGVALDGTGSLYVADLINQVVRRISWSGTITTVAGTGVAGYSGDNGPATSAKLNSPVAVAVDGAGDLFIADFANNRVREVNASSGIISTVAGGGAGTAGTDGLGDGGPATQAVLNGPSDLAVDAAGNLYIADSYSNLIREVSASSGIITVVAGGGAASSGPDGWGDGGQANAAILANPTGVALDVSGNIYVADNGHDAIRRVNASTGMITVVAGTGIAGYLGDNGPAVSARLKRPWTVRIDAAGDLFIADFGNSVVREVSAATGVITTLAGTGSSGYTGDNGPPNAAQLQNPTGLATSATGNIYIADYANNVIRCAALSMQTVAFPSTAVGTTSKVQVSMANIGNQTLTLTGISVTGSFGASTSGTGTCSSSSALAPGGSCAIPLTFAPTAAGSATGTLACSSNSMNLSASSASISLTGMGTATALPQVSFSATALTFGSQVVGSLSAPQTITLSNAGTASLSITSIWLVGQNATDFGMTTNCGTSLAPNASCAVSVTFSPVAAGVRSAQVTFNDSASSSPQTVTLTGAATAQVSLSVSNLSFGQQNIGSSVSQTVTLSNQGSAPLALSGASVAGTNASDFAMTTNCTATLAAGVSCAFSVMFTPSSVGTRTASLVIADGLAGASQTVALTGVGTGQISVTPAALTFGSQTIATSTTQTITISNISGVALNIDSVWLSGPNASDFRMSSGCATTLAASAACTVSVTFVPLASGARTASVSITESGAPAAQIVALNGNGSGFATAPGSLRQISVGADGTVWGLNSNNSIYRWDTVLQTWDWIPGSLAQIYVGNATSVWGLNSAGAIYQFNTSAQTWVQAPGSLAQLSIGSDGDVWGINGAGEAYHYVGAPQYWQGIGGVILAQISVGFDGAVWATAPGGQIYRFNPELSAWEQIAGVASQISVGADGSVWALNTGQVYRWNPLKQVFEWIPGQQPLTSIAAGSASNLWGITTGQQITRYDPSTQSWIAFSGGVASLGVAANGSVWGLDSNGGIHESTPAFVSTPSFHQIAGPALASISATLDGNAWGLDSSGNLYAYNLASQNWSGIASNVAEVTAGFAQNVWALDTAGRIYRFDTLSQMLLPVAGALAQIAVAGPNDVWGRNASGFIYRYNLQQQSWNQVPGVLAQLSVGFDGTVWGINGGGQVYRFSPQAQTWINVAGQLGTVSVGSGTGIWGLDGGAIYEYSPQTEALTQIGGALQDVAVGFDRAVWGVNAAGLIYQWNATSGWSNIIGTLTTLSVGGDAVVWGLDGSAIFRYY